MPYTKDMLWDSSPWTADRRYQAANVSCLVAAAVVMSTLLGLFIPESTWAAAPPDETWKAGVARVDITPEQSLWMAGYGSRDHPAEGTLHKLWAKALALEDANGRRAVLVTTDLLGLPGGISDHIRRRLKSKLGLSRAQVMLTSSHTHGGPVLQNALYDIYPLDKRKKAKIEAYSRSLEKKIVETVLEAFSNLRSARLASGTGVVRFAVNRRHNEAPKVVIPKAVEGPMLHSVPVLRVKGTGGQLMAVAFGYACHNTTLQGYKWSGDYAGFAQLELEEDHPGATALFFAGAGADQNPIPRRTVPLARQYGRELAAAVERVLSEPMRMLAPRLQTRYEEIDLKLTEPPTRQELQAVIEEEDGYQRRWARRMLAKRKRDEPFRRAYPYPIQVWRLGDQRIVALGGEVVAGYALRLKQLLGRDLMVVAYANDVMSYIPTRRVLRKGGYEGFYSQRVYGLPTRWAPSIENHIIRVTRQLVTSVSEDTSKQAWAGSLARQLLDTTRTEQKRRALVQEHLDQGVEIVRALTRDLQPGTPEEYERIPWIFRTSIGVSRRNNAGEIRRLLELSLPEEGKPLRDWQAVVVGGGVINGLSEEGIWPGRRVAEILAGYSQLWARWRRALKQAAAMSGNTDVPLPTRYDALRMIAMQPWHESGERLAKHLEDSEETLQMGAVSGLADMLSPQVAKALLSAWNQYTEGSRALAFEALLRTPSRTAALLEAITTGQVAPSELSAEQTRQLRDLGHPQLRTRARQLLPTSE
jgi:hypothetical protein